MLIVVVLVLVKIQKSYSLSFPSFSPSLSLSLSLPLFIEEKVSPTNEIPGINKRASRVASVEGTRVLKEQATHFLQITTHCRTRFASDAQQQQQQTTNNNNRRRAGGRAVSRGML